MSDETTGDDRPGPLRLAERAVHLGLGATIEPQPPFTGMEWYVDYTARVASDGDEGRLVSMHTFTDSWESWEMHPHGSELVICTRGRITLVQEVDDHEQATTIIAGEYLINLPGTWHTADIGPGDGPATAVFITAGRGTEHRPR